MIIVGSVKARLRLVVGVPDGHPIIGVGVAGGPGQLAAVEFMAGIDGDDFAVLVRLGLVENTVKDDDQMNGGT